MTNEKVKNILEKLQIFFDSSVLKNNEEILEALDIAIEAVSKKEELTETEEYRETPFDRVFMNDTYYHITALGDIAVTTEHTDYYDDERFNNCNYFNNADFAKQVALHQLLYRRLLKFKLQREVDDEKFGHCYFLNIGANSLLYVDETLIGHRNCNGVYFNERSTAELALKEVVEPFLNEYPNFIWNWRGVI